MITGYLGVIELNTLLPPPPEPLRLIPLYVGVAVALTLAVALILGLITPRFSLWLRKSMHNKEPLPNALVSRSVFFIFEGLCAKNTPMFPLQSPF